jgi:hypothetical protein
MLTGIRVRKNYFLKLLLNSQKRPGSGSAIRKNAGSGSALNQYGFTTPEKGSHLWSINFLVF